MTVRADIDAEGLFRAIAEVGRELGMRRRNYPRWVAMGRLKLADAQRQFADLAEAMELLTGLELLAGHAQPTPEAEAALAAALAEPKWPAPKGEG